MANSLAHHQPVKSHGLSQGGILLFGILLTAVSATVLSARIHYLGDQHIYPSITDSNESMTASEIEEAFGPVNQDAALEPKEGRILDLFRRHRARCRVWTRSHVRLVSPRPSVPSSQPQVSPGVSPRPSDPGYIAPLSIDPNKLPIAPSVECKDGQCEIK